MYICILALCNEKQDAPIKYCGRDKKVRRKSKGVEIHSVEERVTQSIREMLHKGAHGMNIH